jgi:hypothetical protein
MNLENTNHYPITFLLICIGLLLMLVTFVISYDSIDLTALKLALKLTTIKNNSLIIRLVTFFLGIVLLLTGIILFFIPTGPNVVSRSVPTATVVPTITTVIPTANIVPATSTTTSMPIDSYSSLIPKGKEPTINDQLKDNSKGYDWTTPTESVGSCSFTNGLYVLSAPGGLNNGIGCYTTASTSIFGNFVYQIKMTILKGMDDTNASAVGPTFRLNAASGQEYQVTFDVDGDWQVQSDKGPLVSNGPTCLNPCLAFHTGLNQPNYITIRAFGNSIQVQINGQVLGSYTDSSYPSGTIGVGMAPGKDTSTVAFSDVRVWKL